MMLPYRKNASIPQEKLTDYLLSETHVLGKFKAKFFRELGFNKTNVELLEKEIRIIVQTKEVNELISSPYGIKYLIEGPIKTPNGPTAMIQTIWIIESGTRRPRFITAYPL